MKSCLLASTLLLICFTRTISFAQKNFKPGFVVVGQQDTLHGYINSRNWNRNPVSVEFRKTPKSENRIYDIAEISAFKVEDESYVKAAVMVDVSPTNLNELSSSPTPTIEPQTVLLRILVNGPKNLFCLVTRTGRKHFFIGRNQAYEPLINYRYNHTGGQAMVIKVESFKEQLQKYLEDCHSLKSEIAKLDYDLNAISELFQKYYDCQHTQPTFAAHREQLTFQTGILAGMSVSKLRFIGSSPQHLTETDYKSSYRPSAGLFLNLTFPRTRKKLSLNNEIMFTSLNASGHHEQVLDAGRNASSDMVFELSYLKLNNLLRYKVLNRGVSLFISTGISNGVIVQKRNHKETTTHNYSGETIERGTAIDFMRKYEQGLVFGIGSSHKKVALDVRYELGNGIADVNGLGSPTRRLYVLLAYQF